MKHLFYIILLALAVSACSGDPYYEEVCEGYYFVHEFGDVVCQKEPKSFWTVMNEVDSYRAFDDHILIRQSAGSASACNLKQVDARLTFEIPDNFRYKDLEEVYAHGWNTPYYYIFDKNSRVIYGPYIYDELVVESQKLGYEIF